MHNLPYKRVVRDRNRREGFLGRVIVERLKSVCDTEVFVPPEHYNCMIESSDINDST